MTDCFNCGRPAPTGTLQYVGIKKRPVCKPCFDMIEKRKKEEQEAFMGL